MSFEIDSKIDPKVFIQLPHYESLHHSYNIENNTVNPLAA